MTRTMKIGVLALALVAILAFGAMPAFAQPPCQNPPGAANGWEPCGPCCDNPRGEANGWVSCGNGCCRIPPGQIVGWVPCGQ